MYICVVCSHNRPPLLPLSTELRKLLESLVFPFIITADVDASYLLLCSDCHIQMQSVHQFQKMALNGLRNLKHLLKVEPTVNGGYSNPEISIPLKEEPVKNEPEMDTEPHSVCHVAQSDFKSEHKVPEPVFEPQYEVKCEFACFEPNIELTIGEPESPSHLKFKPPNAPQPERAAKRAKPTKVVRKAKLATSASLTKEAKNPIDVTGKDVKSEIAEIPVKKKRVQKKPQPVPCLHCNRMFKGIYNLRAHFDSQHAEKKPVGCDICGRMFRNAETLRRHKYHHKRDDKVRLETYCVECSLRFSTPAHYKAHLLSLKHTPRDQYEFECEVCKMKFPTEKRLKEHVDGVHLGMKKFTCATCAWSFTNRSALRRHVSREHEARGPRRTHVCDVCGNTFMVKKCLEEHLLVHRGLRPYKCELCPADFSYKAALYTHNQLKHLRKKKED